MKKVLAIILCLTMVLGSAIIVTSAQTTKIDSQLLAVLENKDPDEFVDVYVCVYDNFPNATEMPSWPDKEQARVELKEFFDKWYRKEIVPVVFENIEYKEIFVGSGIIMVSVKAKDVERVASYDIIRNVYYCSIDEDDEVFNENESEPMFEKAYTEQYPIFEYYNYDEVYYHYNDSCELEWALVYAQDGSSAAELEITMDIGNVVVYSEAIYSNFRYKYGVYDAVEGKFYDLFDLRREPYRYEGLLDVLVKQGIGQLIGDMDKDGKITILDATAIQRCLAGLDDYPRDEYYSVYDTNDNGRMSDFDRDGGVSILDATAIQKIVSKQYK